jgi:hypothetical protein
MRPAFALSFELYAKQAHSGCCLPFSAHAPLAVKKGLVKGQCARATRVSSPHLVATSLQTVTQRLLSNGYPLPLINNLAHLQPTSRPKQTYSNFVRIPYVSQRQCTRIRRLLHATDLSQTIRIIFTTEQCLAWQFRPKPDMPVCPATCTACTTCTKKGACFKKHVVYMIRCLICQAVYVGQTDRTIRSRIAEHANNSNSAVNAHMATHGPNNSLNFRWSIVTSHSRKDTREAIESVLISQQTLLMNGCEGICVLPFLRGAL